MTNLNKCIIGALVLVSMNSCLKDENILAPNGSPNIVEFYDVTAPVSAVNAPFVMYVPTTLELDPQAEFQIAVSYSGAEESAPQDIVVTLEAAPSAVLSFNTSQGTSYFQMAASAYDLPSSVTIKKGEKRAYANVVIRPLLLSQTVNNALAIKIGSATHGEISGNFGTVIFSLPIKSIWQGTYRYTITNNFGTIDANIGGMFTEDDVVLSTVGPNLLRMNGLWQTYSGYSEYQFNSANDDVTAVRAFSGSNLTVAINQVILVDPVNLIFEVRWTGLGRGVVERFERTGD